jgi:AraC family transcriptional regulator of adaptative response / DNA-3-methyladenine glycosylase II
LGQQVSVSAGRTLAGRLVTRFGRPILPPHEGLTHLFPTAADLAHLNLDVLGIPKARAYALQALALATSRGELTFNGSAIETAEALAALPGIGKWTAEYVALRALYEPDAFPASDLVLRRAAATNGTPLTARTLEECANAWRPWRGYAAMHLWRSTTDTEKRLHKLST